MFTPPAPPGQFIAAYEAAERRGCDEVVSIHISEAMSGTIGSAVTGSMT